MDGKVVGKTLKNPLSFNRLRNHLTLPQVSLLLLHHHIVGMQM